MSERGRKADASAEKPDNAQAVKDAYNKGALTGAAIVGAVGVASAVSTERTRRKIDRDMRRAEMAARRYNRTGGSGGGLYVTPGTATKRDITKRFKNI